MEMRRCEKFIDQHLEHSPSCTAPQLILWISVGNSQVLRGVGGFGDFEHLIQS